MFFVLLVLATGAAAVATPQPTPDDRAAFALGVARWQFVDMMQDPRVCGIVVLRAHCVALTAGASNDVRAFAASGDSDRYKKEWSQANDTTVEAADWKTPRATWLKLAGIVWEGSFAPYRVDLFDVPKYRQLARRAREAGPYASLIPAKLASGTLDAAQSKELASLLVPRLGKLFPPDQLPALAVGMGNDGDRRLGVFISTANQMLESPALFTQPQARSFLAALTELLGHQADAHRAAMAQGVARRFLTMNTPEAWRATVADFRTVSQLGRAFPRNRVNALVYGAVAAQIAYNAAFLRQGDQLREQLRVLGNETSGENGDATLAAKRQALLAIDPRDYHALNAAATALTLAITQDRR